jgi:purine-cytosine permease-like protein
VLLPVIHGPIATNIAKIYSSSLSALTLDLKVARWKLSLVVGVLATAFTIWLAFRGDIAEQIDAWLVSLIMWISPWAAIMFVHFWILERGRVEVDGLYDPPYRSRVGDVRWVAVGSFLAGVVAAWLFQYGLVSVFQGPLSKALNNVDLSWLSGMTVAGGLSWTLERRRRRRARPVVSAAAPEPETLRV